MAESEGDDDCIVEIAGDGYEIGDEVERHREIGDDRGEDELLAPRNAPVGEEAAEEDDEVRDDASRCSSVAVAAGDDEPDEEERVGQERSSHADQDPLPHAHTASGYGHRRSLGRADDR
jgi:hypothetical protein